MVLTNQNFNSQNFDIDTDALKETQRIVLEILNSGWFERDYKQWFYSVSDPQGRFDLIPDKYDFKEELKKLKTELDLNSKDYNSHFKSKVRKYYYKKDDFFSEIRKEVEESFSEMISEILLSTAESEYKNFAYHLPPFVRNKTKFYSDLYSTLVSDNTNFANKLLLSVLNNDSIKNNFFKLIETMLESSNVSFNLKLLTDVSSLISLIDETSQYYKNAKVPGEGLVFDDETEKELDKLKKSLVRVLKHRLNDSEFVSEQENWDKQEKFVSLRVRNLIDVCVKYLPKASLTKLCKNSLRESLKVDKLRLISLAGRDIVNLSIEDVDSRLLISFVSLLEKGLSGEEMNSAGKPFSIEVVKAAKDLARRIKSIKTTFGLDSQDNTLIRSFLREFRVNYENSLSLTILEELDFKHKVVILDLEDVVFDKSWGTFEESVALLSLRDFGRRFKLQGTQLILCAGKGEVDQFFKNNSYKEFIYCDSLKRAKTLSKTF